MKKKRLIFVVCTFLLAGSGAIALFTAADAVAYQERNDSVNPSPTQLPLRPPEFLNIVPENSDPQALTISSIGSPNPTCTNYEPGSGICYLNWSYLSVSASPSYVISMTLLINGKPRMYASGFFQTSMNLPASMFAPGFRVVCGFPNHPLSSLGNTYNYEIRARSSDNSTTANYGQVSCPADIVKIDIPLVMKR